MDTLSESSQAPSTSRENEPSTSLSRRRSIKIKEYPWRTTFILHHDDLELGWERYDQEKDEMVPLTGVMSIAAKIAAFEHALFNGAHTQEIMATRGYLQYNLHGPTLPPSSLASLAAAATKQMTNNKHSNAQHRANSLLTSYRLLDILAELLGCHQDVELHNPAEIPKVLSKPTHLLETYGEKLCDIPALFKDFRSAWERDRREISSTGTDDVLLGHIKALLDSGKGGHAQKVEANLLASALPIIIMSRSESLPRENEATPVAPELLEGLDEFIKGNYIEKQVLGADEQKKVTQLFTKRNIKNMRKPHGVSVHVSPILNLVNTNLQKSEISEDDIIQTSRMIGTHDIPLLLSIERHIWNAIWAISEGENPNLAIDALIRDLPWDELEKVDEDHEINKRFVTSLESTFADDPRAPEVPESTDSPPSKTAAPKRKRNAMFKTKTMPAPVLLLSHTETVADALDVSQALPFYRSELDMVCHDVLGVPHRVFQRFHFPQTYETVVNMQVAIITSYHQGKPRYISAPASSAVDVISSDNLYAKAARDVQNIFCLRHILETGRHVGNSTFNLATLATAGPLSKSILVRDESQQDDEVVGIVRSYTLENLYSIRHSGRAVRTLQMSHLCAATNDIGAFATDRRAYDYRKYCPEKDHTGQDRPFPSQDLEWSLVALKGATQDLRMSPDGAAMCVECTAGKVWYILLRPRGCLDFRKFGDANLFQNDASLNDLLHDCDVEGVLLLPGMRLFVRPCTPCAFVTIENAVLHGVHFYALSTMPETFFGMVHNLASSPCITRSENSRFRHLIRLIVLHVHRTLVHGDDSQLPFFRHTMDSGEVTMDNVLGLFAVIYIGILCNALDHDTYKLGEDHADRPHLREGIARARMAEFDYNAMPQDDRAGCTFARGCAYELRDWFCHHYRMEGSGQTTMALTEKVIANQACALLKVKLASKTDVETQCTAEAVKRQISKTFRQDSPEWTILASMIAKAEHWDQASPSMYISLDGYTISTINNPAPYNPLSAAKIQELGASPLDECFQSGIDACFKVALPESITKKKRSNRS